MLSHAEFERRFRVDPQTTLEVMALEAALNEEVVGVYILPVKYTRKKSKLWDFKLPQPIHRVTFTEPRPIPKSTMVRSQMEMGFDMVMQDIEEKLINHRWIQNHKSCLIGRWPCDMYELCWGKTQLSELVDRPMDDVAETILRSFERQDI